MLYAEGCLEGRSIKMYSKYENLLINRRDATLVVFLSAQQTKPCKCKRQDLCEV